VSFICAVFLDLRKFPPEQLSIKEKFALKGCKVLTFQRDIYRKEMTTDRTALIAGSTGIVGGNLAALLLEQGWTVYGLARRPSSATGVTPLAADLRDRSALVAALAGIAPTHLFFCTWLRQPTEAENVSVNGEMIENLFAALRDKPLQHAALVTGTKHYLGPFEAYGQTVAETAKAADRRNACAGASNERCRPTMEGTCREAWTGGAGCKPACLLAAYGRRPGQNGGMCERHDREPGARLLRVSVHTRFFF
jgi:NAD(P)-dependent dehydrogenase (short-subunit alcohol dehydrogenase family)